MATEMENLALKGYVNIGNIIGLDTIAIMSDIAPDDVDCFGVPICYRIAPALEKIIRSGLSDGEDFLEFLLSIPPNRHVAICDGKTQKKIGDIFNGLYDIAEERYNYGFTRYDGIGHTALA